MFARRDRGVGFRLGVGVDGLDVPCAALCRSDRLIDLFDFYLVWACSDLDWQEDDFDGGPH